MDWIKQNWKKLLIIGVIIGIVTAVLVYFFVLAGNADSKKEESKVEKGSMTELSGTYLSSTDSKKAEIFFVADGTKEARGYFSSWSATLEIDGSIESAKITLTVDPSSVNTENSTRDKHLTEEDFFNVSKYPEFTFTSKNIKKVDGENYKAIGTLNFLGEDWDFEFPFTYRGKGEIDGKEFGSFKGSFKFDHTGHGMKKSGDADDVAIEFYVDMIKGGSSDDESDEDDMDDDDFDLDDDEDAPAPMPVREHDELLDKVEEEAAAL